MAESCDARSIPAGSLEDARGADALYKQGLAYYRQRQWQQARESFQSLKALDPGRRGIDALLDELEIFIRLESFVPTDSRHNAPSSAQAGLGRAVTAQGFPAESVAPAERPRSSWSGLALIGVIVLVSLAYGVANPHVGRRIAELREAGQDHAAAQEWSEAINAYEELLLLSHGDAEVREYLWVAYYERGHERSVGAQRLEDLGLYQESSQQWEKALADFRAAQQVHPAHSPDPRGDPALRIAVADERKHCTAHLVRARRLRDERRWTEAIQVLLLLQSEMPDYRRREVLAYLGEACLEGGLAAVASADTTAGIHEGVKLIERASQIQPSRAMIQTALRRAQGYHRAVLSYESQQWNVAITALEGLLMEVPNYAAGRGRETLCRAYLQRASERFHQGELWLALADYRASSGLECGRGAEVEQRVRLIVIALTPTATPTQPPIKVPATRAPASTPTPAPTLPLAQAPTPPLLSLVPQPTPLEASQGR